MVSVIIPTLNEAELLPDTLKAIRANRTPHEILVIDGGSADETVAAATEGGSRVINSLRARRATPMNIRTKCARGAAFFLLHGDPRTGPSAMLRNEQVLRQPA